jgi:nicotinamide mononucleotide transporter
MTDFSLFKQLLQDLRGQTLLDWVVLVTALIYVGLSARNNVWCWPFGMLSCGLWAYVSAVQYQLYVDSLLQVFYVGMAIWGWYRWTSGGRAEAALQISRLPGRAHLYNLLIGTAVALAVGRFFGAYTAAAASYWDAFTTVFSVIATLLLVNRRLENWLYWIVINLAYAGLYASRGAALFALLMVCYTLIAVWGWQNWRKIYLDKI